MPQKSKEKLGNLEISNNLLIKRCHGRIGAVGPDVGAVEFAVFPPTAGRSIHSADVNAVDEIVDTRFQPLHGERVEAGSKTGVGQRSVILFNLHFF